MDGGVLAGKNNPNHDSSWILDTPVSIMVGTLGKLGLRLAPEVAKATTFPASICGFAVGDKSKNRSTRPPMISV